MAECAVFVLWDGQRALMENRPDLGPGGDYYVYPGGKVRPGENLSDAMRREALEEAGAEPITYLELTQEELWSSPNRHSNPDDMRGWRVHPFLVLRWSGNVPERSYDHQHAPYAWIAPADIRAVDESPGYTCRQAIAQLLVDRFG